LLADMQNLNGEIIITITILQHFSFSFYSFHYPREPSVSARILLKTRLESSDLQDTGTYQKLFFIQVFCLLLFEVTFTFTSFFKAKKSKRSHRTVEIKVFLAIFA
jgi:hypothetical protein